MVGLEQRVAQRLKSWDRLANIWHFSGVSLSLFGVASGLAITAFTQSIGELGTRCLGFLAALSPAVLGALKPVDMGNRYRRAWRVLDDATMRFEPGDDASRGALIDAVRKGEDIIGLVRSEAEVSDKMPPGPGGRVPHVPEGAPRTGGDDARPAKDGAAAT